MGRSPSSDETNGVKKGPWSPEEDQILVDYIQKHGHGSWRAFPKLAGLNRCGKSCRLRWTNYLRPDIKRGKFSPEEEQKILNLHSILGNKWSAIATHLPGRTDNEIKNFWNTHLKKKLIQMGFDPMTHRPRTDVFAALPGLLALANLCDLVECRPWDDHSLNLHSSESALQSAKIQYLQHILLQSTTNVAHQSPTLNPTSIDPTLQQGSLNFINTMPNLDLDFGSTELMNNNPVLDDFEQQVIVPNRYDTNQDSSSLNAFFCQGENSNSSNSLLLEGLPPLTEASMGPTEDVCSNMSSFWAPELLLDDPFMTDFV